MLTILLLLWGTVYSISLMGWAHVSVGEAIAPMLFVVPLTDEIRRRHARLIRLAAKRADMSLAQAAAEADRDPGQFTRQIDAQEGTLRTLYQQPADFWRWYALGILEEYGLPMAARRAAQIRRPVVETRKRMLKAALPQKAQVS